MSWLFGQANTPPHLEAFFTALATNGLTINLEKCVFAAPSLEILRHTILATGAAPTVDHAAKIKNYYYYSNFLLQGFGHFRYIIYDTVQYRKLRDITVYWTRLNKITSIDGRLSC